MTDRVLTPREGTVEWLLPGGEKYLVSFDAAADGIYDGWFALAFRRSPNGAVTCLPPSCRLARRLIRMARTEANRGR